MDLSYMQKEVTDIAIGRLMITVVRCKGDSGNDTRTPLVIARSIWLAGKNAHHVQSMHRCPVVTEDISCSAGTRWEFCMR
jgi:hypothetical protein